MILPAALALGATLVVLDDGEKIARDAANALPASPWPDEIALFAMRGETVALQAVVESRPRLAGLHATFGPFTAQSGSLEPSVDTFAERFVFIARPSGNERAPGSLAFTADAAPDPPLVGWYADALVPGDAELVDGDRAALWIDLRVPLDAAPDEYTSMLHVSSTDGVIGARRLRLRVLGREMPWGEGRTMVYYEPQNLERRMGDRGAEAGLRQLLHAHHLSAIHDVTDPRAMALDDEALSGELFTSAKGYRGPGEGKGEGVFAIGAYGSLGAPTQEHLALAERMAAHLAGHVEDAQVFLYAIDEQCSSPWGGGWRELFAKSAAMRGVRVGVTCGDDPVGQRADLVMVTAPDYVPERARLAKEAGKWVWAYNGQRPAAGPLMLDVPAVDLRANAWIAARYGVERWFYWESTYWYDDNRGGAGGWDGFDPFVVAETFHNADGDWANGDGILVYPGTQIGARGMTDFGARALFPSVRLKNLRRGVQDRAYIDQARAVDREEADRIVRRMVPSGLAHAGKRASWPERGAEWLAARRDLAGILERTPASARPASAKPARWPWLLVAAAALFALVAARRSFRRR